LAVRALRRHGIGAVVLLDDLARFNADHGTRIVPMPLAVYLSMFEVHQRAPDRWVEMWLDKMKSCVSKLATAIEYAASFRGDDVSQVITAACEKRPQSGSTAPSRGFRGLRGAQAGTDAARDARGRGAETARIVQHLA
jgi:hypothetical protein